MDISLFWGQRSNNKVTRSKSRSNLKITITRSIFKWERHSKAQNVASSMANVSVWLEYQYIAFFLKQTAKITIRQPFWKFLTFRDRLILTKKFGKICKNYLRKSIFDTDQVGDGVTVWPPSLNLLYSSWNESVTVQNLRDTGRSFWLIITNLGPHM